jgi:hypothetical protein
MMSSTVWRMSCPNVVPHHAHAQHDAELLCRLAQWQFCHAVLSGHCSDAS